MARSRNIKPGFFTNDDMGELPPLSRILFLGLTTLADFRGNVSWRPKRIKIQILPYDDCDIKELAINLERYGFIRFYSGGDFVCLNIVNFTKHQNPHKNERDAGSDIPEYSKELQEAVDLKTLAINPDKARLITTEDGTDRADSLILIPDSLILIPEREREKKSPPSVLENKNGACLPKDWSLPDEWKQWTEKHCPLVDPDSTAEEFKDWAHGNSNRAVGRKADWFATWRNWCRRDQEKYEAQKQWQKNK